MVVSNQLFEAQAFILDKIKGKVGETAQATANATDKLAEMRKQLMNAFAKPVADAFDLLTVNAEQTFQKLEGKFTEAGKIFANALERAVAGDASRIAMIGETIGDLIVEGIKGSLKGMGWIYNEIGHSAISSIANTKFMDFILGGDGRMVSEFHEDLAKDSARYRRQGFSSDISGAIEKLTQNIEEMNRQMREDAVYKAGFRAGGTDRITDPSKVDRIFEEFLDETKKTNQLLERFEEDRKGP
jgi:hypothetical protein